MPINAPKYSFFSDLARIVNAGQSRSVLVTGDVHDLFFVSDKPNKLDDVEGQQGDALAGEYLPLMPYLCKQCDIPGTVVLVYELNGPIRCVDADDHKQLREAWITWKTGLSPDHFTLKALTDPDAGKKKQQLEQSFDQHIAEATGKPTVALELLRQLTLCAQHARRHALRKSDGFKLIILIEAADLLMPAGDGGITKLGQADRHRIAIMQDWLSDPGFIEGEDTLIMLAESRSAVHGRVSKLPQVLSVSVPSPDEQVRRHYIDWFAVQREKSNKPVPILAGLTGGVGVFPVNESQQPVSQRDDGRDAHPTNTLAALTAGLSIHALRQLLVQSAYSQEPITAEQIIAQVESYILSQLGEDVVEFSKPTHTLEHVVGYTRLKAFLEDELVPRMRATGDAALPGAAIAGPIGAGKTFIFEAVAGSLGLPVLVLKNIRSQYFGQTDVIFERLRRVLEALGKVILFVDEADTQFGGVGADAHATERRLTGKVQAMMSDPKLRGKVVWLLMTARIERLSPDIRRPGRVGDLIIPVLDSEPGSDDHRAFVQWVLKAVKLDDSSDAVAGLMDLTTGYSSAGFAALRSQLKSMQVLSATPLTMDEVTAAVHDLLPADIGPTRRVQTLQALVNCTRRSLLPDPEVDEKQRAAWSQELEMLDRSMM
ncbi:MAG: ATP-binding protein [Phycisphaeraceae bacterium]|nr:ATP-binding protein [Phycisphaeraceae bacterium]